MLQSRPDDPNQYRPLTKTINLRSRSNKLDLKKNKKRTQVYNNIHYFALKTALPSVSTSEIYLSLRYVYLISKTIFNLLPHDTSMCTPFIQYLGLVHYRSRSITLHFNFYVTCVHVYILYISLTYKSR